MDYIIKRASVLSFEDQVTRGITGIPQDWPIEKYPYVDNVPDGFEQITEENLQILIDNNKASYDSWLASKMMHPPKPAPQEVITQFEVNDKDLKLAKCKEDVNPETNQAIAYVKVPGEFGIDDGRWIAGGYATIDTFDFDDYYKVYIEDKDRKIAWAVALALNSEATEPLSDETIQQMGIIPGIDEEFPLYPTVKSYTDDDLSEENQGWYTDPLPMGGSLDPVGFCEIEPIAGYGHCPAGFYIKLVLVRPNKTTGTIRASIWWGKKE